MLSPLLTNHVRNIPIGEEKEISSMIRCREIELEELTDNNLYCTEWGKTVEELESEISYLKKELKRRKNYE